MKTTTITLTVPAAFARLLERVAKAEKQSTDAWLKDWLIQALDAHLQSDEASAARLGFLDRELRGAGYEDRLRALAGVGA